MKKASPKAPKKKEKKKKKPNTLKKPIDRLQHRSNKARDPDGLH